MNARDYRDIRSCLLAMEINVRHGRWRSHTREELAQDAGAPMCDRHDASFSSARCLDALALLAAADRLRPELQGAILAEIVVHSVNGGKHLPSFISSESMWGMLRQFSVWESAANEEGVLVVLREAEGCARLNSV